MNNAMHNKGEGSVFFRKDRQKWCAQYYEPDPITEEKKVKRKLFDNKEEAEKYLQSIMFQKENPIFIKHHGIPLNELMRTILQNKYETNRISEAQYDRVEKTIKAIEKTALSHKNIENISPDEIQRYANTLASYSNSTIKKFFEQFNQAFRYALGRGYILRNPMEQVIKPKSKKSLKDVRAMTLEEEQKFVDYLFTQNIKECPYRNEFLIQLFMGLRIGECLALSTSDIDLKNKSVFIHKTLTKDINGRIILSDKTKTKAGTRYVPIPEPLFPYVVEQMKYCKEQTNNDDKLLFKPPFNRYTDAENVNRTLDRILKSLGIEHMSSHSLRHTYATRSIEAGVTPVVLQKLMGHTDISITLNTYTSVFDKYKDTELEKVNNYYLEQNLMPDKNQEISSKSADIIDIKNGDEKDR